MFLFAASFLFWKLLLNLPSVDMDIAMYCLVCYYEDKTYDVCEEKDIRQEKDGTFKVKCKNFIWYKAKILLKHRSSSVLENMIQQLTSSSFVAVKKFNEKSPSEENRRKTPSPLIEIQEDITSYELQTKNIYVFEDIYDINCNSLKSLNLQEDPDYIPDDPNYIPDDPNYIPDDPNYIPDDPNYIPDDPNYIPDTDELKINVFPSSNSQAKRNFCLFCKKTVIKISRHLENVHKDEELVKKFTVLPKKCQERLKLIETIRRNGNFIYNTSDYNKGDLIVCRRPVASKERSVENFETCFNCKGYFSKLTIKRHVDRCSGMSNYGERTTMMMGRKIRSAIHPKACHTLKNDIFPVLNEDFVVKAVRYDELLILYCNQLCVKYRSQHNHKQVRSFIRLMGRFLLAVKKRKATITSLKYVFHPENYNLVIESINEVARLTDDGQYYGAPSVASNMGTYLKKVGNFLIGECIKISDETIKKQTEDFLHLMQVSYSADVTRTALETQLEMSRQKKIELPIQEDLKAFYTYINNNRLKYQKELNKKFNIAVWMNLAKFTLLTLHIFNARRAGEIERILISDFKKFQTVDEDTDKAIYNSLSEEGQNAAKCYGRFVIRGKLGRNVPVLLHKDHLACAELILSYRLQAGVPENNPYLFGLPSSVLNRHKWLDACVLMRKYSVECGAVRPDLLRGTTLRKHLATQSIFLNLQEKDISDLAQFMGHADKIHRSHYRLPVPAREIAQISVLLEKAVGIVRTENGLLVESDEEVESHEPNSQKLTALPNVAEANPCPVQHPAKRRCVSPMGYVKRTSWSTSEMEAVNEIFRNHIEDGSIPSLKECRDAILTNASLQSRSPTQLKVHIQNIKIRLEKQKKKLNYDSRQVKKRKSVKKVTWSTPEKKVISSACESHFRRGTLPSFAECKQLIAASPILQNRTPEVVKAKINNDIKKKKQNKY